MSIGMGIIPKRSQTALIFTLRPRSPDVVDLRWRTGAESISVR